MDIKADARVGFPRDLVFSTYRDHLPELVPHLPNVRKIQEMESEDAPDGKAGFTRKLNLWFANAQVPKLAQSVVKPEYLQWNDHALWNANDFTCEWRVEMPDVIKKQVVCHGKNHFIEDKDGTVLQIRGTLQIDVKGFPLVPKLLAGKIGPTIESFVVKMLTPNLTQVSDGVQAYLRQKQ